MKKKIEILKLEDRILFDAAGAVAVADAVAEVDAQQDVQNEENQDLETIISAVAAPENVVDNTTTAQEDGDADADADSSDADDTEDIIAQAADDINDDVEDTEVINTIESLASDLSDVEDAEFNVAEDDLTADVESEDSEVELDVIDDAEDTDDDVVFADIATTEVEETRELVIINSSVKDIESLTEGLSENTDVLILESDTDALDVINEYLDNSDANYSSIHIISHGSDGYFLLNGDIIDIESVAADQASWLSIGEHLTEDADILIYGCNVAASEDGQALVAGIANLTGADVVASTDVTGSTGDWDLEFAVGDIETLTINPEDYAYRLYSWTTSGTDDKDARTGSLDFCIENAEADDVITITSSAYATAEDLDKDVTITGNVSSVTFTGNVTAGEINIASITVGGTTVSGVTIGGNLYLTNTDSAVTLSCTVDASTTVTISANANSTVNIGSGASFMSDTVFNCVVDSIGDFYVESQNNTTVTFNRVLDIDSTFTITSNGEYVGGEVIFNYFVDLSGNITSQVALTFNEAVLMDGVITGITTTIGSDVYLPIFTFEESVYSTDSQDITLGSNATFRFESSINIYADQTITVLGEAEFSRINFYGSYTSGDATLVGGSASTITINDSNLNEVTDIRDFDDNRISSTGTVVYGNGDQNIIFGEYNDVRLGDGTYTVWADDITPISTVAYPDERNVFTLNGTLFGAEVYYSSYSAISTIVFEGFNYDGAGTIGREDGTSTYDYNVSILNVTYNNASNLTGAVYSGTYGDLKVAWDTPDYTYISGESTTVKIDGEITVLGAFEVASSVDTLEILKDGILILENEYFRDASTYFHSKADIVIDADIINYGYFAVGDSNIIINAVIDNRDGATLCFADNSELIYSSDNGGEWQYVDGNYTFIIATDDVDNPDNNAASDFSTVSTEYYYQVKNAGTIMAGYMNLDTGTIHGTDSSLEIYTSGLTEVGNNTLYQTNGGDLNIRIDAETSLLGDLYALNMGILTIYTSNGVFNGSIYVESRGSDLGTIDGNYFVIEGSGNEFNGDVNIYNTLTVKGSDNIFNGTISLNKTQNSDKNGSTLDIQGNNTQFNGNITVNTETVTDDDGTITNIYRAIISVEADNVQFNNVENNGIIKVGTITSETTTSETTYAGGVTTTTTTAADGTVTTVVTDGIETTTTTTKTDADGTVTTVAKTTVGGDTETTITSTTSTSEENVNVTKYDFSAYSSYYFYMDVDGQSSMVVISLYPDDTVNYIGLSDGDTVLYEEADGTGSFIITTTSADGTVTTTTIPATAVTVTGTAVTVTATIVEESSSTTTSVTTTDATTGTVTTVTTAADGDVTTSVTTTDATTGTVTTVTTAANGEETTSVTTTDATTGTVTTVTTASDGDVTTSVATTENGISTTVTTTITGNNTTFNGEVSGTNGLYYIYGSDTTFLGSVNVANVDDDQLILQGEFNINGTGTQFKGDVVSSTLFNINESVTFYESVTASNLFTIDATTTFNGNVYVKAIEGFDTIFTINENISVLGTFSNTNNGESSASKVVIATGATATFTQNVSNISTGGGSAQFDINGTMDIGANNLVFSNSGSAAIVNWNSAGNTNIFKIENAGQFFIKDSEIKVNDEVFENFANLEGGTLSVINNAKFGVFSNFGSVTITSGETYIDMFTNSGSFTSTSATVTIIKELDNSGTMTFTKIDTSADFGTFVNSGIFTLSGSADVADLKFAELTNSGTFTLNTAVTMSTITNEAGGSITFNKGVAFSENSNIYNSGTITLTGNGSAYNFGNLANFTNYSGSVLNLENTLATLDLTPTAIVNEGTVVVVADSYGTKFNSFVNEASGILSLYVSTVSTTIGELDHKGTINIYSGAIATVDLSASEDNTEYKNSRYNIYNGAELNFGTNPLNGANKIYSVIQMDATATVNGLSETQLENLYGTEFTIGSSSYFWYGDVFDFTWITVNSGETLDLTWSSNNSLNYKVLNGGVLNITLTGSSITSLGEILGESGSVITISSEVATTILFSNTVTLNTGSTLSITDANVKFTDLVLGNGEVTNSYALIDANSNSTITLNSASNASAGGRIESDGTVIYNVAGDIYGGIYNNMQFAGSATFDFAETTMINGTMVALGNDTTLEFSSEDVSGSGTFASNTIASQVYVLSVEFSDATLFDGVLLNVKFADTADTVTVNNDLTIWGNLTSSADIIKINADSSLTFETNSSIVVPDTAIISADIENNGTLSISQTYNTFEGKITNNYGATLSFSDTNFEIGTDGLSVTNYGTITVVNNASLTISYITDSSSSSYEVAGDSALFIATDLQGAIVVDEGAEVSVIAGATKISGDITNQGDFKVETAVTFSGKIETAGEFTVSADNVTFYGDLYVANVFEVEGTEATFNNVYIQTDLLENTSSTNFSFEGAKATVNGAFSNINSGNVSLSTVTIAENSVVEFNGAIINQATVAGALATFTIASGTKFDTKASITNTGSYAYVNLKANSSSTLSSVTNSGIFTITGELTISNFINSENGTLTVNSNVDFGTLDNAGTISCVASEFTVDTLINSNVIKVESSNVEIGTVNNSGTLSFISSSISGTFGSIDNSGSFALSGSSSLYSITFADITNSGSFVLNTAVTLGNKVTNTESGTMTFNGFSSDFITINNAGELNFESAIYDLGKYGSSINNTGTLNLIKIESITLASFVNSGTLSISVGEAFVFSPTNSFTNSGTVVISGTESGVTFDTAIINTGTITIGAKATFNKTITNSGSDSSFIINADTTFAEGLFLYNEGTLEINSVSNFSNITVENSNIINVNYNTEFGTLKSGDNGVINIADKVEASVNTLSFSSDINLGILSSLTIVNIDSLDAAIAKNGVFNLSASSKLNFSGAEGQIVYATINMNSQNGSTVNDKGFEEIGTYLDAPSENYLFLGSVNADDWTTITVDSEMSSSDLSGNYIIGDGVTLSITISGSELIESNFKVTGSGELVVSGESESSAVKMAGSISVGTDATFTANIAGSIFASVSNYGTLNINGVNNTFTQLDNYSDNLNINASLTNASSVTNYGNANIGSGVTLGGEFAGDVDSTITVLGMDVVINGMINSGELIVGTADAVGSVTIYDMTENSGSSIAVAANSTLNINQGIIASSVVNAGTIVASTDVTFNNSVIVSNGSFSGNSTTITFTNNTTGDGATSDDSVTLWFTSDREQTVFAGEFAKIGLSGLGDKVISSAVTIANIDDSNNGSISIVDGGALTLNGANTINSTVNLSDGGTLNLATTGITFAKTLTNEGSINIQANSFELGFDLINNGTLNIEGNNFTGDFTNNATINVSGTDATITGTMNGGKLNVLENGSATFNTIAEESFGFSIATDATLTFTATDVYGDVNNAGIIVGSDLTFNGSTSGDGKVNSTGTVTYKGTGENVLYAGDYVDVAIMSAGYTLSGVASISGSLLVDSSVNFDATSGTVSYNGVDQEIFGTTYGTLVLSGSGTKTISENITVTESLISGSDIKLINNAVLEVANATFNGNTEGTGTINSTGSVSYLGSNSLIFSGAYNELAIGDGVYNVTGNVTIAGATSQGSGSFTAAEGTTVTYNGNNSLVSQSLFNGSYDMIALSGLGMKSVSGAVSANSLVSDSDSNFTNSGALTVTNAVFNGNTYGTGTMNSANSVSYLGNSSIVYSGEYLDITLGDGNYALVGDAEISGKTTQGSGAFTATNGTVSYNASGDQELLVGNYNNITLSNGGVKSVAGNMTISGDAYSLDGTSFVAAANTTTTYNGSGSQHVMAGSYANIVLAGQGTKYIATNGNLTVAGDFIAYGTSASNLVTLTSEDTSNNWVLDATSVDLNYVKISYSTSLNTLYVDNDTVVYGDGYSSGNGWFIYDSNGAVGDAYPSMLNKNFTTISTVLDNISMNRSSLLEEGSTFGGSIDSIDNYSTDLGEELGRGVDYLQLETMKKLKELKGLELDEDEYATQIQNAYAFTDDIDAALNELLAI